MVLVLAVLVGLVLGRLLGGRVSALAAIPIRAPWLFYAAIAELRKRCWTQFDARVVAALERLQAEEPNIADVRQAG